MHLVTLVKLVLLVVLYGINNIDGVTTGNLNLKEEEGDSYSIGFVWEPVDRLAITFDAFHIQLNDIVSTKDLTTIVRDEAVCRARENGESLSAFANYPASYCQQVYDSIVRGGRDFTPVDANGTELLTFLQKEVFQLYTKLQLILLDKSSLVLILLLATDG